MYLPDHFREDRPDRIEELIRQNPLATLVTIGSGGLIATHLPLLYEPLAGSAGVLHGHVSRANPRWQDFRADIEALAIFHGPHSQISTTWYPTKEQTGRVVPTWNYAVVHAYGPLEVYTDAARLRRHVAALTAIHEKNWTVDDAPPEFIDGLLRAIVGIDIRITRVEGKWKMSQNRPPEDRAGVVRALSAKGDPVSAAVARLVEERAPRE